MEELTYTQLNKLSKAELLEKIKAAPIKISAELITIGELEEETTVEAVDFVVGLAKDAVFLTGFHPEMKYRIKCLVDLANKSLGR